MPTVELPYVDAALDHLEGGGPPTWWRHLHWGLFDDPSVDDDSPERYYAAAEALTARIVEAGEVGDRSRVLDVGCGFGGTLDYLAGRRSGCALVGLNIDERQLRWARRLVGGEGREVAWVQADGCSLPVADGSLDHVLAVECIFHFPSRKLFLQEAARVLRPGGTLALSDFLMAPGQLAAVASTMSSAGMGDASWYGHMAKPLTTTGYERLARRSGLELVHDDDVTAATLPTYPALRRLADLAGSDEGLASVNGLETLARQGALEYHVLTFRPRER
ncbi:MAG TPA: class I SAM-dependent methyltransferase [Actinomycetes bacterium]|nr:class I SAM-dependent methyltransferase [Actinomycetes bacterium]